ncbi:MAG: hypothetical protein OEW11_01025 [Nitrospirota bacterium]|nr:hypothetical protein [Nitrospirota bacterium]
MRQTLSDEGFANIFANFLGQGLERLIDPDNRGQVHGVAGLPVGLMEAACNNLRIRADFDRAFVLTLAPSSELHISPDDLAQKVAADPDIHLIVFVPEECREVADKTFAPAFFSPVDMFTSMENMETQLIQRINQVPVYKRIATLWSSHAAERLPILRRIDYLINIISLCLGADEMGMFFHKLDLLPDGNVDVTGNFADRVARNVLSMTILCDRNLPIPARLDALRLNDAGLARRLGALLKTLPEDVTSSILAAAVFQAERDDPGGELSFDHWRFIGEPGWN